MKPLLMEAEKNTQGLQFGNTILVGEIWRPITPNIISGISPFYFVSSFGRVVSLSNGKERFISTSLDGKGYPKLHLQTSSYYGKTIRLHRLVMLVFFPIQNPEKYQVNHKDGNKLNNNISNLEWCTNEYNEKHAFENNLKQRFFTDEQVHLICKCLKLHIPFAQIANELGFIYDKKYEQVFSAILHGRSYARISKLYDIGEETRSYSLKTYNGKFSDEQVHIICKALVEDLSNKEIARRIGMEYNQNLTRSIRDIYLQKSYKSISLQYEFPERRNALETRKYIPEEEKIFTIQQIEEICQLIKKGFSNKEIFEKLNGNYNKNYDKVKVIKKISLIRNGKYRKDISSKYNLEYMRGVIDYSEFRPNDVEKICKSIEFGLDNKDIIKEVLKLDYNENLSKRINLIRRGKTYKDISSKYNIKYMIGKTITAPFTENQVHSICKEIINGASYREIAEILGYDYNDQIYTRIYNIKNGLNFREISSQYGLCLTDEEIFNNDIVNEICKQIDLEYDNDTIINNINFPKKYYNYAILVINKIRKGEKFKEISCRYKFYNNIKYNSMAVFTIEEAHIICKGLEKGLTVREIIVDLLDMDFSPALVSNIANIKRGKSYKEISSQYNISK